MTKEKILELLPYKEPFLFVDDLEKVDLDESIGSYTFRKELDFYRGHFKNYPVTPGVIIIECIAQIGLACMAILILESENRNIHDGFALSNTNIDFLLPVFPGEKVKVFSKKMYYRLDKLKCKVKMTDEQNRTIAQGTISGMLKFSK